MAPEFHGGPAGRRIAGKVTLLIVELMRLIAIIGFCIFLAGSGEGVARQPREATLIAGGDVLLDRGVRQAMDRAGDPGYLFQGIAPLLKQADLALANLECPLTLETVPIAKQFSFRSDPAMAPVLRQAGFTVLNLANNHSIDYGRSGLVETIQHLEQAGIVVIGAGSDQKDATQPRYLKLNGLKIALLGFVDMPIEGVMPLPELPGPAFAEPDQVVAAIRRAKRQADWVVVTVHWGQEYQHLPSDRQRRLAHLMASSGADMIVGHHPHVIQSAEMIGNTAVFYSVGNLVFDQSQPDCSEAILVQMELRGKKSRSFKALPLQIRKARPAPASPTEGAETLGRLAELSPAVSFHVDADGWWTIQPVTPPQ